MEKLKEKCKSALNALEKFFASDWFVLAFAGIMMLGWITKCEYLACVLMVVCICLIFISSTHLNALIPILCMFQTFIYVGLGKNLSSAHFIMIGVLVVPLILSIIYYFVHNKKIGTEYPKFKMGKLFWGLIAVLIAVALGGLGYDKLDFYWVLISAGFVGLVVGVYLLLLNRTKDDGFKITVCRSLLAFGVVVFFQVLVVSISSGDPMSMFLSKTVDTGWATSNAVAIIFAFVIPPVAYLGIKSKHPSVYLLICFAFAILGLMMQSRGVTLLYIIEIPAIIILMLIASKKRLEIFSMLSVVVTLFLVLISIFNVDVSILYKNISANGLSNNGRFNDWRYFYELYTENKDFGIGFFGYTGTDHVGPLNKVHSTIFQIWFCTGIVGTILFVVHYIQRYLLFFVKPNLFKVFMLVTLLVFELYGLIDMTLLMYYLMIALFVIFVAVEKEPNTPKLKPAGRLKITYKAKK